MKRGRERKGKIGVKRQTHKFGKDGGIDTQGGKKEVIFKFY